MKQITLWKRGDRPSGLFALVDDKNYEWLNKFNWWAKRKSNTIYAETRVEGKLVKMHNLILPNTNILLEVDHKNNNGLDNQENNLRLGTHSQNMANSKSTTNTSGYRGVMKRENGKYVAVISCKGVDQYLGDFTDSILAAKAYNKTAIALFGEFAKLNEVN